MTALNTMLNVISRFLALQSSSQRFPEKIRRGGPELGPRKSHSYKREGFWELREGSKCQRCQDFVGGMTSSGPTSEFPGPTCAETLMWVLKLSLTLSLSHTEIQLRMEHSETLFVFISL